MKIIFLSKKQYEVYVFIKDFHEKNSYVPTLKEIAENFKLSIATVQGYMNQLEIKKAITKDKNKSRAYRIHSLEQVDELEILKDRIDRLEQMLGLA